ncbi:radical SAM protein [Sinorhizobium meliloti]|nr:radical SAM protein [Sinorhizobium meliloti]
MNLQKRYFATALSNLAAAYDKYARVYDKTRLPLSTFPDRFFTLDVEEISIGLEKASRLCAKTGKKGDRPIVIETTLEASTLRSDHATRLGAYFLGTKTSISALWDPSAGADKEQWKSWKLEDALAESLAVSAGVLFSWDRVKPRSLSWLPVGHACQASCPFCFSKASVSENFRGKLAKGMDLRAVSLVAKRCGAQRAVITGGGEPTILNARELRDGIETLSSILGRTIMITNGHLLGSRPHDRAFGDVKAWADAGLSVLAFSRHAASDEAATRLMGLSVRTDVAVSLAQEAGITPRLIAVLQKGGVEDEASLDAYLNWAVDHGVSEINFKELYVSTALESNWADQAANLFSEQNAVPLSLILDTAKARDWAVESELPWGAPVFSVKHNGQTLKIAAYTEPSVHWERANGIARSWNVMADGTVMASLEDSNSTVNIDEL